MLKQSWAPVSVRRRLEELRRKGMPSGGRILRVEGIPERVVTNPSIPFLSDGGQVIAVRADPGLEKPNSRIVFCSPGTDGVLRPIPGAPELPLEDPFVTTIGGRIVLGGVRVIWQGGRIDRWVTDFYIGESILGLKRFLTGPSHMKDIRLVELPGGSVGVFSRPQGRKMVERYGCQAKIGFAVADSLGDVTAEFIENAPYLEGLLVPEEWGGVNQAYVLNNGLIGAVGHVAWGEMIGGEHYLHYYSVAFALDPETSRFTEPKAISSRACFEPGLACFERLRDVTFTSGVVRKPGGRADLYTGLGDIQIGRIEIEDPFLEYEDLDPHNSQEVTV